MSAWPAGTNMRECWPDQIVQLRCYRERLKEYLDALLTDSDTEQKDESVMPQRQRYLKYLAIADCTGKILICCDFRKFLDGLACICKDY